jgi:hypothetical protein
MVDGHHLRRLWIAALPLAFVVSCALNREGGREGELGAGGGSGGEGQGGVALACTSPADCGADTDCLTRTCTGGKCGADFVAVGSVCDAGGIQCNGEGQCVTCVSATECAMGACSNGVQTGGETCSAAGECVGVDTQMPCEPYVCGAGVCLTSCNNVADCARGSFCSSGNQCVTVLPVGDICTAGEQCASGFCADDVCCDAACDGLCVACSAPANGATNGTCAPVAAFSSEPLCVAPNLGCNESGGCASCGFTQTPAGGTCPDACTSCNGGTCDIQCAGSDSCKGTTISCPSGWDCAITCGPGASACENTTIDCPPDHDCALTCLGSNKQCKTLTLECGVNGTCSQICGTGSSCDAGQLNCGQNTCTASCVSNGKPTVNNCAGNTCPCMLTGC